MSCKQEQERVEEQVVQPVDQWVEQWEEQCRNEPCNPWLLCLNKVFCWLVTVLVKVTVWVLTIVVRWVFRTVCTVVMVVVGVLALLVGNTGILKQAIADVVELVKDAFYTAVGAVIYYALAIVDFVQSVVGLQGKKRGLSEKERGVLRPIFRDALLYDAISIIEGNAGLLGISGQPFTMGFKIYMPSYSDATLVHECVHVWQFQFEGTKYIGNSALNQLDAKVLSPAYDPYEWTAAIDSGATWYTLRSVEAQAQFIEDVFLLGLFVYAEGQSSPTPKPGDFFREDEGGSNLFEFEGNNYTSQANAAWRIVRTS